MQAQAREAPAFTSGKADQPKTAFALLQRTRTFGTPLIRLLGVLRIVAMRFGGAWGDEVASTPTGSLQPYPANPAFTGVPRSPLFRLLARAPADSPRGTLCLGLATDRQPLFFQLDGNVLVTGGTGSDRTGLMHTMVASLAALHNPEDLYLLLLDSGQGSFHALGGLPHLIAPPPQDADEALTYLVEAACVVRNRMAAPEADPIPVVVVLEDLHTLAALRGREAAEALHTLLESGPDHSVYSISAAESHGDRPPAGSLTGLFPVRLVGPVENERQARLATGLADSGAERLRRGRDFLAVMDGEATRFQPARATEEELAMLVEQWSV